MILSLENLIKLKVKTLDELRKIREEKKGELMVFISGCFDIIHADHIDYLAWGRKLGDYLLVGINNDESVEQLKGSKRPIIPLEDRIKQIATNHYIDYIVVFKKTDVVQIIEALKPDIFARGKDYVLDKKKATKEKKEINQKERRAVENYGGKICFLDKPLKYSTSKLIEHIKSEL